MKRAYFGLIDRPLLEGARCIHFTAPQEAEKASRLRLTAPFRVIPIPYSSEHTTAGGSDAAAEIVFIGRLHPKKGFDLLLPSFARVRAAMPQARLVIAGVGEPEYEASLVSEIEKLGLRDAVEFTGFIEGQAKGDLLRRAAVFCLPSYEENFGVAVVEALGAGLPVVITKGVDLWPSVASYESGLVAETSIEALAVALLALLKNPGLRRTAGENGLRQVRELYSMSVVGQQLADMYESAVRPLHK
jgi:glycosyltransferase involved in cell wall biosynthesis